MTDGRVVQVNVSDGGVPKLPVPAARITTAGVEGDRQREVTVHGGPHRAVSLLGIEAIRRVTAEGPRSPRARPARTSRRRGSTSRRWRRARG